MTDLRDRIAAVLASVGEGRALYQMTNADAAVMADAVIRELEADYVLVPKSHTLARNAFRYGEHYGI